MTNTVEQAIAYARANLKRLDFETGRYVAWPGWCASFVYRAGGFERAYETAMLAGSSSGHLDEDYRSARKGEIHYWAGVGGDGHVAIDIGGDGSDRLLLMASSAVSDPFGPGAGVGAVWFSQYKRLGIPYRGHTFAWGAERLAGTEETAPSTPTESEDDMPDRGEVLNNFRHTDDGKNRNGTIYFRSPTRGIIAIRNPYELGLLQRNCALNAGTGEVMFPAEIAMINYYLVAPAAQSTVVDTAALTKTVKDTLESIGKTMTVDAQLSDADIKLISKTVNEEFAKRVSS